MKLCNVYNQMTVLKLMDKLDLKNLDKIYAIYVSYLDEHLDTYIANEHYNELRSTTCKDVFINKETAQTKGKSISKMYENDNSFWVEVRQINLTNSKIISSKLVCVYEMTNPHIF